MRYNQAVHDHWRLSVDTDGRTLGLLSAAAHDLIGLSFPAEVPGCVHTDLLNAGELVDPFLDDNERKVAWVGRTDWRYDRPTIWEGPEHEQLDLVFEGLDTVADIEIDGVRIGSTRNMHRSYRFDVSDVLATGHHHLAVRFTSAYTEAEELQEKLGRRPNAYPEPFNYVRKMACSFGWDWGPTLVTSGIWRPMRLEGWSIARIARARPFTDFVDGIGKLTLHLDVERTESGRDRDLAVIVKVGNGHVAKTIISGNDTDVVMSVDIADASAWYPVGYGEQSLYLLEIVISDANSGDQLDSWQRRIGFRSLEVDRTVDDIGGKFTFRINDIDVFAKGVNWIPDDIFPSRMTLDRYKLRLQQAADANVNLVRVWGGGIYESEDFYQVCDELGLLTWQDFLFSCASYPEEEPIRSEVIAEARENVARLSSHPSLVLWNGNNETLWLHEFAHWAGQEGGQLSWGENYYLKTLPAIVAEVDPSRPYSEGSPWSGSWKYEPNDPDHQTFHSWEVWNREDYLNYRKMAPRFVSEFGWQAPPTWATLRRSVSDDPLMPNSAGVLHHQKADDGNGKLDRGLAPHFTQPFSTDAWHYLTQLNQVRAVQMGVEHWRSHWPRTAGTVLWQLNDLWPATSWAAIDGDGRLKPLYFALRDMYSDRLVTFQPRGMTLVVALINDTDHAWSDHVLIQRLSFHGEVSASQELHAVVPPRSVKCLEISADVSVFHDVNRELLVASVGGERALWFGAPDKDLEFPEGSFSVETIQVRGGLDVTVTANTLIRDLLLQPDRIDPGATTDRGFVTLLPGESTMFRVRSTEPVPPATMEWPYVLTHLATVLAESQVVLNVE